MSYIHCRLLKRRNSSTQPTAATACDEIWARVGSNIIPHRFLKKLHLQPTVSMLTRAAAWPNGRPKVEEHKSFAKLAHTLTNIVQAKANIWTMPTSEGHSALTWGSSPPST